MNDKQRFYCEHSRDVVGYVLPLHSHSLLIRLIHSLCVFEGRIVASAELMYSSGTDSSVRVRIWNADNLRTESTFDEFLDDQKLITIVFAPNVSHPQRSHIRGKHKHNEYRTCETRQGHVMILKGNMDSISGRVWDWKSSRKRVSTAFHVGCHFVCCHIRTEARLLCHSTRCFRTNL